MDSIDAFRGTKRFVVEGRLGAGGMGVVHRVRDLERGEIVALKTMGRVAPNALLRFKNEFRSLTDISHPNVVQLYELVSEGDQWFFTMELVDGVDLLKWVASSLSMPPAPMKASALPFGPTEGISPSALFPAVGGAPLRAPAIPAEAVVAPTLLGGNAPMVAPPSRRFAIRDVDRLRDAFAQLTRGLMAIHAAGKLHRDVKPSNIVVTRDGRVVLLDFGIASDAARLKIHHADDEPLAGTPAYISPEQAGLRPATPASDWYAVGVVLYEALTGRLPFEGQPFSVLVMKQHQAAPPPSSHVDGIPADFEALAMDLLERDPRARIGGEEILERLAPATSGRQSKAARGGASSGAASGTSKAASASRTDTEPPFVGRRAQLEALHRAFETSGGGLSVAMLHGRSGMGKSALAARFLGELAAQPDVLVFSGRCYERESVPFKAVDPVVDELRRWLGRLPESDVAAYLPADLGALALVFPVLGDLRCRAQLSQADARAIDVVVPQELLRRAFAALREVFARITERYRLVVHIDDLQWCDADSVHLLEAVLAAPAPSFLFVCAFRSELAPSSQPLADLEAVVKKLGRQCQLHDVEVGELSDREANELARALVDSQGAAIVKLLSAEARGNPLFIAELARWAKERGLAAESVAISLEEVIVDRARSLPPEARALLETLAVARAPLGHRVAARAAGLTAKERSPAFLLRSARLVVTRGAGDDDPIEAANDRVRETIARSLDVGRRRACHAGIARALAESRSPDAEAVFEHYRAAGDTARAKEWVLPAADAADAALAFIRAADLYSAALELDAAPKDILHRRLGDALANAGRLTRAADAYLAGAAHAPARESHDLRRMAAECYLKSEQHERGIDVLRTVLDDVALRYPQSAERAIASLLWHEALLRVAPLRRRMRSARSVGERELARIDAAFAGASGLALADPIRGADFANRALALALQAGEPVRLCRALALAATNTSTRGESARKRAEQLVAEAQRITSEVDEPHAVGLALLAAGTVHFFFGEWRSARAKLERADRTFRDRCRAVAWELANTQSWTCNVLILSGELAEAARRVPALLDEALSSQDRFAQMHLVYPACVSAIVADDVDRAREIVREGAPAPAIVPTAGHWGVFISDASIDRYHGDAKAAWQRVLDVSPALDASPLMHSAMVRAFSNYERGLSALAAAATGHDRSRALRAAKRWGKALLHEKLRYAPALGHFLRAGVAAVKGDHDTALVELDAAVPRLDDSDLGYLTACARHRRGELLGGSVGREQVARARSFFEAQHVKNVERCLAMSAPGFDRLQSS